MYNNNPLRGSADNTVSVSMLTTGDSAWVNRWDIEVDHKGKYWINPDARTMVSGGVPGSTPRSRVERKRDGIHVYLSGDEDFDCQEESTEKFIAVTCIHFPVAKSKSPPPTIGKMKVGDIGYVIHWALQSDRGEHWLYAEDTVSATPGGSATMRIERKSDGFFLTKDEDGSAVFVTELR